MDDICLHPGGLELTAQLLQPTGLPVGAAILDAGCGAGETVNWLRQQGFAAWGIDQKLSEKSDWLQEGRLQALPYAAESFAAVLSECTAFICGDTGQMLRQCWRVLQPGGWLLLSDVYFAAEGPLPQFADDRPVTLQQWRQLLAETGFLLQAQKDVSALWKPFVIAQLWAGRTLEELWGGCLPDLQGKPQQYKPGYFLLWARKEC